SSARETPSSRASRRVAGPAGMSVFEGGPLELGERGASATLFFAPGAGLAGAVGFFSVLAEVGRDAAGGEDVVRVSTGLPMATLSPGFTKIASTVPSAS